MAWIVSELAISKRRDERHWQELSEIVYCSRHESEAACLPDLRGVETYRVVHQRERAVRASQIVLEALTSRWRSPTEIWRQVQPLGVRSSSRVARCLHALESHGRAERRPASDEQPSRLPRWEWRRIDP